jgi:hypothetical protein
MKMTTLHRARIASEGKIHLQTLRTILKESGALMVEPVIQCPNCQKEIKLTESLAAPLVEVRRREFERKLAEKDSEIAGRMAAVREQEQEVAAARKQVAVEIEAGVRRERQAIAAEEARTARMAVSDELLGKARELADLEAIVKAKDEKLAEAQNAQAELLRKQRELDDQKRELELTVETRVQRSLGEIHLKARHEVEDELALKVAERDEAIAGLRRQIEVLKQKAEQGSQQLQGEVQELGLESLLAAKFPSDLIEPVPKGEFGGDILHKVRSASGQQCGMLLWESKRTKNWSESWLTKLRDDQRSAKADFSVLVSRALPREVATFDLIDGVWVVAPRCAVPVAIALRQSLIEVATVRQTNQGQHTKMGMIYQYLTGPKFRAHIGAVVEKFSEMQNDLARERRTMIRLWAKREQQIRGVIDSTAGMYGDLQAIAGKSLNGIAGLEIEMLPSGEGGNVN